VYAAVDVGTNTVRLLLASLAGGRLSPVRYFRRITRLGGGFVPQAGLSPEAMERTLAALLEVAAIIREAGDCRVRAVGTAALRRAANGPQFAEQVRQASGIRLEIIDGEEEARLSARGVLAALDPRPQSCLIFDIGGGSTEFILCEGEEIRFHRSYPLGVVALAENFAPLQSQQQQIDMMLDNLAADLAASAPVTAAALHEAVLVGTAGTVTTLAAIRLAMVEYDWRRVNNLVLTLDDLASLRRTLEPLSVEGREALAGMEKGRGDLIVPGLRIVLSLLARFARERLTVSDFGLLEGIVLSMTEGKGTSIRKN
jgi:exopolyphosphatase/guanosine-5'-triphosphate,3'-diphosphate pyrophosphatase